LSGVAHYDIKRPSDLDHAPGADRAPAPGGIITSPRWNFVRWRGRVIWSGYWSDGEVQEWRRRARSEEKWLHCPYDV